MCAAAEINRLVCAFLPWGLHGVGGGMGGVVGSKACSPPLPPNPLFYFKNACDPAVLIRAGCGLWGCTIEEPKLQPAPLPCYCNRQAVGSGVGGLGLLSAEISSIILHGVPLSVSEIELHTRILLLLDLTGQGLISIYCLEFTSW